MKGTAIPFVRGTRGILRSRGPLLAALLALAGAASAPAAATQDAGAPSAGEPVAVARLRFEFKCYFKVEEWRARGEDTFLKKLLDQRAIYKAKKPAELAGVEGLMAEAYWERKTTFEATEPDRADEMCSLILALESKKDPVVEGFIKKATSFFMVRSFDKAKKFEAAGDVVTARATYRSLINVPDPVISQESVSAVVRLVKIQRKFDEVVASNRLEEKGEMLDAVLEDLRSDFESSFDNFLKGAADVKANADLGEIVKERERIARSTQRIQVTVTDAAVALAASGFKGTVADTTGALFSLEPVGEGMRFPPEKGAAKLPKNPFLWHKGVYTVRAFAPNADKPFATFLNVVMQDAPAAVTVPNRAPEGFVWQAAAKPGGEALFVGRYEVTVAEVEAVQAADEKLGTIVKDSRDLGAKDDTPAWFSEDGALAYAKATGTSVPTLDQWLLAAYAGRPAADLLYPWGREPIDGSRAYATKSERPAAVGGRPAGASPCGAEDMAGNLAEFVLTGGGVWLMGGHYGLGEDGLKQVELKFPLRDPMPGPAVYPGLGDRKNEFLKFKVTEDDGYWTGLRVVIPVPAK